MVSAMGAVGRRGQINPPPAAGHQAVHAQASSRTLFATGPSPPTDGSLPCWDDNDDDDDDDDELMMMMAISRVRRRLEACSSE